MPSRDEMIQALKAQDSEFAKPSREEMVAALKQDDARAVNKKPKFGAFDTAYNKVMQGLSQGIGDELEGIEQAALQGAGETLGLRDDDGLSFSEKRKKVRNQRRADLAQATKDWPTLAPAAEFTGTVASTFVPGMGGASAAKLAGIGAANGYGNSEAEDLQGQVLDTAIGAGTGFVLGKGGEKVAQVGTKYGGKAVDAVSKKTREWAEKFAARAIGAERGTIKKFGADKVMAAGAQALDDKILTPLTNTEKMIAANEASKKGAMEARKAAYDKIDDAGASEFNPLNVATEVEKKVIGGKNMAHDDVKELAATLDPHLSNILSRGEGNVSMAEAQKLVEALRAKAKFDTSRSSQQNEVAKNVYHTVRNAINDAAEKGADKLNISGVKETIQAANQKYAKGKTAEALLENKFAREQGNKILGITNVMTGGTALGYGGATGDWEGAGKIVVGKVLLEKYGAQNAALLLNKVSKSLMRSPQVAELAAKNPKAFQAMIQAVAGKVDGSNMLKNVAEEKPKGETKWANDGFEKLKQHATPEDRARLEEMREQIMKDPKKKKKLISASEKSNAKALDQILREINSVEGEE